MSWFVIQANTSNEYMSFSFSLSLDFFNIQKKENSFICFTIEKEQREEGLIKFRLISMT